MRLRCPVENCPFDVRDDLVSDRLLCPHCGSKLVEDAKQADPTAAAVQAGTPDMAIETPAKNPPDTKSIKLENQIYDGLPPLAVMLALRREQASDAEIAALAAQHPMTEDDWKALSAFESVIDAIISLRSTVMFGTLAVFVNLMVCLLAPPEFRSLPVFLRFAPAGAIVLGACFVAIYVGSRNLQRIRLEWAAKRLPWSAIAIGLVAGGSVTLNVAALFDPGHMSALGIFIFAPIPFNLLVAFESSKSAWRVGHSLDRVSPPEISHRLVEALRYLDV